MANAKRINIMCNPDRGNGILYGARHGWNPKRKKRTEARGTEIIKKSSERR